jgi:hypothetical protein
MMTPTIGVADFPFFFLGMMSAFPSEQLCVYHTNFLLKNRHPWRALEKKWRILQDCRRESVFRKS